jgi:hypothetical protein
LFAQFPPFSHSATLAGGTTSLLSCGSARQRLTDFTLGTRPAPRIKNERSHRDDGSARGTPRTFRVSVSCPSCSVHHRSKPHHPSANRNVLSLRDCCLPGRARSPACVGSDHRHRGDSLIGPDCGCRCFSSSCLPSLDSSQKRLGVAHHFRTRIILRVRIAHIPRKA